jgi:tetratricopeptide (TPR) repeat protein
MFTDGQRDEAIAVMRKAADLDDASEKNVAMENKLVSIRALLGELYLAAGKGKEALVEFEAADKVMPNRFRIVAGAAAAARASGSVEAAKRHYRALAALVAGGDDRPEIAEARMYLAQNWGPSSFGTFRPHRHASLRACKGIVPASHLSPREGN